MDVDLGMPSVGALTDAPASPAQYRLVTGRTFSLTVFDFGLACCAVEFVAAVAGHPEFLRLDGRAQAPEPPEPAHHLMVVSGTVTDKVLPAVLRMYDEMPEPRHVISFGSCANSGGPYWDSYCVTKGVDQVLPVDVYVPGCPPRPEALVQGILRLQHELDGTTP